MAVNVTEKDKTLVMVKCHEGLIDEDRKAVADWREKHWKDTK